MLFSHLYNQSLSVTFVTSDQVLSESRCISPEESPFTTYGRWNGCSRLPVHETVVYVVSRSNFVTPDECYPPNSKKKKKCHICL